MKFESKYPPSTWDWDKMTSPVFQSWAADAKISYELIDRWKLQNKFTNILDLGAGIGRNARAFAHYGFNVRGLDIDPVPLRYARSIDEMKNVSNVSYDLGDMLNMPYPDNSFDAVFADNVVYLTYYDAMRRAISEIHRVLRPNGEVFVKLLNLNGDYFCGKKHIDANSIKDRAQYGKHTVMVCGTRHKDIPSVMTGFDILDTTGRIHGFNPEDFEYLILARAIKSR